ncbi:FecR family protein [Steroidobacter sp.]|uniref:FecR family protein n=1 Tax=Steroidobacter sp. TaxID=1978227 RepID=UPI001A588708|nr:FecR domain-containing protein [Steroidobacter sp.]MBL8266493.1 FecR domain-containing protein [Steroidobacter sp.]
MTANSIARQEHQLIAQHAADWLRRLQSGDPAEHAAFIAWLKQSPLHVQETLLAMSVDDALDGFDSQRRIDLDVLLGDARNVVPLRTDTRVAASIKHPSRKKRWLMSLAASVLLAVTAGLLLPSLLNRTKFETTLGEQRAISLEDGSVVHLNTLSRIRTDYSASARDIYLLEGQAIFRVAHDAQRPFRVHTDTAIVQAIGTQFDVRQLAGRTQVAVIEGVVQVSTLPAGKVEQAPAPQQLRAGQIVAVGLAAGSATEPVPAPKVTDVKDITAWQQRRLVFRKDRLSDIAAEFNRYGRVKMNVEGEQLRAREFSGTFDADDATLLLSFLERDTSVSVERTGNEIRIRPR